MQPPLDCSERERKKVGDVSDGPLFEVPQLQHDLKLRRQFRKVLADLRLRAAAQQGLFRAGRESRAVAQNQRIEFVVLSRLVARFLAADSPGPVAGDRADPASETRRLLKLWQRLERQQKRLLRQILRSLPRTERLRGNDDDGVAIAGHQLVERRDVAQQGVQDQLLIADLWVAAPLLCHSVHSSCKEEPAAAQMDSETAVISRKK